MPSWFNRRTVGWTVVAGLLGFAALHLLVRGPVDLKGNMNLCDWASHWASTRLWVTGQNPYDNTITYSTWIGGHGAFETDNDFWLALLPPAAFAVLSPLGALPPGAATMLWMLLSVASVVAMLWAVMELAGLPARSLLGWIFIAAAVASAPVQTLVIVGQVSLPAIALIFLALVASQRRFDWLAGVMLGIAAALKPQLAGPFFLWFIFFARWRVFGAAVAAVVVLNLVAIIPMQLRGIPWWADWSANIAISTSPGGPNDPTPSGPWRNQMIDLRVWLFTLMHQRHLVVAAGVVISMTLAAAYIVLLTRAREDGQNRFLPLATLSALTLLPVYHKLYDAALLLPALAWALLALRTPQRAYATLALLALSLFLVPFDFFPLIMQRTTVLDRFADTWLWRVVIWPHHALATIACGLLLLLAFWRSVRRDLEVPVESPIIERELAELAPSQS